MELCLYISPKFKSRINTALRTLVSDVAGSPTNLAFNVTPVYTYNDKIITGDGNTAVLVLPMFRNRTGSYLDIELFGQRDYRTLDYIQGGISYWGNICAENNLVFCNPR